MFSKQSTFFIGIKSSKQESYMKAYVLSKHGKPSVLSLIDVSQPIPGDHEVLVKVSTIGINYAEIQSRKGLYQWAPKLPYTLGMEAFGIVAAVGKKVTQHAIGDAVIVAKQYGAYAEYVTAHEDLVLPAFAELSAEENAAFAVNFMTAWVAIIEMGRGRPGDTVLIQAAAGGVGTAAVQIAKKMGCTVYGTVGSDPKLALLQDLGIDGAINYRRDNFRKKIREMNQGQGVDIVLEVVGGEVFRESLRTLNPFGRLIVIGFASLALQKWNPLSWYRTWKDIPRVNVSYLATHSSGVLASHLGYLLKDKERLAKVWRELSEFTRTHQLKPIVGHTFPFDKLPEAHALMESRKSTGKIVITI